MTIAHRLSLPATGAAVLFCALAFTLALPQPADAAPISKPFEISGWIPYWRAATATADIMPHPVVVSEAYAALFGGGESMIGLDSELSGPIIGVVKDVHNTSFTQGGGLAVYTLEKSYTGTVVVKLASDKIAEGLAVLDGSWNLHSPDRPFAYEFLDDKIQAQYSYEVKLAGIFNLFSTLSMIIAGLGLFGLASFTTQQRSKEISIRKSLGATDSNIVYLLSKEFLLIVVTGVLVASPLVYLAASDWLERFSRHVDLSPTMFILAATACLLVVLLPVSGLAFRAAGSNPTDALKCD